MPSTKGVDAINVVIDLMNDNFVTNHTLKITEFALRSDLHMVEVNIRSDMKEFGSSLRYEIIDIKSEVRNEIKILENKMHSIGDKLIIRLSGVMIAMSAITFSALKLL